MFPELPTALGWRVLLLHVRRTETSIASPQSWCWRWRCSVKCATCILRDSLDAMRSPSQHDWKFFVVIFSQCFESNCHILVNIFDIFWSCSHAGQSLIRLFPSRIGEMIGSWRLSNLRIHRAQFIYLVLFQQSLCTYFSAQIAGIYYIQPHLVGTSRCLYGRSCSNPPETEPIEASRLNPPRKQELRVIGATSAFYLINS